MEQVPATVVVTGAARGIGRQLAVAWGEQGARVIMVARSTASSPSKLPGTLEEAADAVKAAGGDPRVVPADLSTEEGIDTVARAVDSVGGCDILVNNAAVSFLGGFLDVPVRRWMVAVQVNLMAPVALTQALLPGMLARGRGTVVNVSSNASVADVVPQLPYGCTKAGLERLSIGLHDQFAGQGISIYCVRIDELIPTEAVTYSVGDDLPDVPICAVEDFAASVVELVRHPEVAGEVLTHGRLRELGFLA